MIRGLEATCLLTWSCHCNIALYGWPWMRVGHCFDCERIVGSGKHKARQMETRRHGIPCAFELDLLQVKHVAVDRDLLFLVQ